MRIGHLAKANIGNVWARPNFGRVQGTYEVGPWHKPVPPSGIKVWLPTAQLLSLGRTAMHRSEDRPCIAARPHPQFLFLLF